MSLLGELENVLGGGSLGKIGGGDGFLSIILSLDSSGLSGGGIGGSLGLLGLDLALVFLGELGWGASALIIG